MTKKLDVLETFCTNERFRYIRKSLENKTYIIKELHNPYPPDNEIVSLYEELQFYKEKNLAFFLTPHFQRGNCLFFENFEGNPLEKLVCKNLKTKNLKSILSILVDLSFTFNGVLYHGIQFKSEINTNSILVSKQSKIKIINFDSMSFSGTDAKPSSHKKNFYFIEMLYCNVLNEFFCINSRNKTDYFDQYPEPLNLIMKRFSLGGYSNMQSLGTDLQKCLKSIDESGELSFFLPRNINTQAKPVFDDFLYGRELSKQKISNALEKRQVIHVLGIAGIGKTFFLKKYIVPNIKKKTASVVVGCSQTSVKKPYETFFKIYDDILSLKKLSKADKAVLKKILSKYKEDLADSHDPGKTSLQQTKKLKNLFSLSVREFFYHLLNKLKRFSIIIDDAHNTDHVSIEVLREIINSNNSIQLLLLYRNNEVDQFHPLKMLLKSDEEIRLHPLVKKDIHHLISETIESESEERLKELSGLVYEKTHGIPLYLVHFFNKLIRDNLMFYNEKLEIWDWKTQDIGKLITYDNVAQFLIQEIQFLNTEVVNVLSVASVIGNYFNLDTLSHLLGTDDVSLGLMLWQATQNNLIIDLTNSSDFVDSKGFQYKFSHDKVQQCFYDSVEGADKEKLHLKISVFLEQKIKKSSEISIFDIAFHKLKAKHQIPEKQIQKVIKLLLRAAKKAKQIFDYTLALSYFEEIEYFTHKIDEFQNKSLLFEVYFEKAESLYLNNDTNAAKTLFFSILKKAESKEDSTKIIIKLVDLFTTNQNFEKAIYLGNKELKKYSSSIGRSLSTLSVAGDLIRVYLLLRDHKFSAQGSRSKITDQDIVLKNKLLSSLTTPSYLYDQKIGVRVVLKLFMSSIKNGNTYDSPYSYMAYALLLCGLLGNPRLGYKYAKYALQLNKCFKNKDMECQLQEIYASFILPWLFSVEKCISGLNQAYYTGLTTGDFYYAGIGYSNVIGLKIFYGFDLLDIQKENDRYSKVFSKKEIKDFSKFVDVKIRIARYLLGSSDNDYTGNFDYDNNSIEELQKCQNKTILSNYYIFKMMLHCIFRNFQEGLSASQQAEKYRLFSRGLYYHPEHYFYQLIILLNSKAKMSVISWYLVRRNIKKLRSWAKANKGSFYSKYQLALAELYKHKNKPEKAAQSYAEAISFSMTKGYTNHVALGNELYAHFLFSRGATEDGKTAMNNAKEHYLKWNALRKVKELEENYARN